MKQKWKGKIWSILLSAAMVLGSIGVMPMTAKAASGNTNINYDVQFTDVDQIPADVGLCVLIVKFTDNDDNSNFSYTKYIPSASYGEDGVPYDGIGTNQHLQLADFNSNSKMQIEVDVYDTSFQRYPTANLVLRINGTSVALTSTDGFNVAYVIDDISSMVASPIMISLEFNSQGGNGGGGQDPNQPDHFDGKAYLAWENTSGKLCYHLFDNLNGFDEATGTYPTNYISTASATDESGNSSNFSMSMPRYSWVLKADADAAGGISSLSLTEVLGDGTPGSPTEHGLDLDPVTDVDGNNAFYSNADRNFRAIVYDPDKYVGVAFSQNQADYTYFPGFWNPTFFIGSRDVSGTSKSAPAVFQTCMLESTVKFTTDYGSADSITSVAALGVNPGAVTVSKENYTFTLTFHSNFYDHVTFELTGESGAKYYLMVQRLVSKVEDLFGPNQDPKVRSILTYSRTDTYKNYLVMATIYDEDGSEVRQIVDPVKYDAERREMEMAGFEATEDPYIYGGGKGLYNTDYEIAVSKSTIGVDFTVLKAGTTDENFAGAFAGSGRGTYYDCVKRKITFPTLDEAGVPAASFTAAGSPVVSDLTVSPADDSIFFSGLAAGSLAVEALVYSGDTLFATMSTGVATDGSFADSLEVPAGSYTVKVANYEGGSFESQDVTVGTVGTEDHTQDQINLLNNLYNTLFGREGDEDGMEYWLTRLQSHITDGANLIYGFLNSPEFQSKEMTDAEYVKMLYEALLGRTPSDEEVAGWVTQLEAGKTRLALSAGFVNSPEFKALYESIGVVPGKMFEDGTPYNAAYRLLIEHFYAASLGREPDESGINDWVERMNTQDLSIEGLLLGFLNSPEYLGFKLTDEQFVDNMYLVCIGREPDAAGKATWLADLAAGVTRDNIARGFLGSKEFGEILDSLGL